MSTVLPTGEILTVALRPAAGLLQLKSGARVLLTGRVRERRFRGEVTMSFSTCEGTHKLDAVRTG